jgi:HEAT repeat protein
MSNLNENSLTSYERSHPNRGLTLENLSVKSLNKNLNKSINSMNNSINKSGKISKKSSNLTSKNVYTTNKSKKNSEKNIPKNSTNKTHQPKIKSFSNNSDNNKKLYNQNTNTNSNNNNLLLNTSSNNRIEEESELYNYFYYNDVCDDNDIYLSALNELLSLIDNIFSELDLNGKINKLLELSNDESKNIRLGSLVCLYLLIKNNYNLLEENNKNNILSEIISLLQSYEKQDELFLLSCLEICSLFGPHEIILGNFGVICMFLTDFNFPKLQLASFHCLMCTEFNGINILIELASKDEQDYQRYILNQLIHTPHIQRIIIINAIFNELYSNDYKKRNIALCAINRLNYLLNDEETLQKLVELFNEPKIDNQFIASILRNKYAEKLLLNELKTNTNEEIKSAICSVLCYRFPKKITPFKIILDSGEKDLFTTNSQNMPGSFFNYYGKICPVLVPCTKNIDEILENEEVDYEVKKNHVNKILNMINDTSEDRIEINQRDFLAALQRMIQIQYDHRKPQLILDENNEFNFLDHLKLKIDKKENENENNDDNEENEIKTENPKSETNSNNQYYYIIKYNSILGIKTDIPQENESDLEGIDLDHEYISEDIIKSLGKCLNDYSDKVRDAAATSLGIIGLPESSIAIDDLIPHIKDKNVEVRSKIIWDIGRIAPAVDNSVISEVAICLQSNMWKVKKATLYTLMQFGNRCNKNIIPYLINMLKESPINKQLIAETIIRMGIEGENNLLLMMNSEPDSNYKLKSAVIRSYSYADITSPNIDFILESIFKLGNNEFPSVRKACIFTIHELASRANENITYLKKKNIIPFYYDKLKDKDLNIQGYAINCLKSLGPEGELVFIEGFTKDNNYLTRINCGLGLADSGIQNMRTLLLGLQDKNKNVRNAIEKVMIVKMPISEVVSYFSNEGQLKSLKITVKELLDKKNYLQMVTVGYLEKLLSSIEECEDNNNVNINDENVNTNNFGNKINNNENVKNVDNNMDNQGENAEEINNNNLNNDY